VTESTQGRTRIGPWRLLDIVQASMSIRAFSMMGGGGRLPEYGPPDGAASNADPDCELPGSNITDGEQRQALERERARRFVRARRTAR
jgi:hypothetical protein